MKTMSLGRTGLVTTRLGMGGIQLAKISSDEAVEVVRTGLDLGINLVETARGYWDSEEKIGKALAGRRENVIIATKAEAKDAEEMLAQIDKSLGALGTDYIDLYQYHGCDKREQFEQIVADGGALEGLMKAKEQGKIRAVGFSSHQLSLALEILKRDVFDSAQLPISFMNTENHDAGLFDKAKERDVGLIAMKPFGGGRLANARLCMGYVLSLGNVVAVVGVDTVAHVRELAALADDPPELSEDDCQEMRRIKDDLGTRFCRACNYCQPCPQNINIYGVLWLPVYVAQMGLERALSKANIDMVRKAADCTECRECEERCPFNLDIVAGLKRCRSEMEHLIAEHGFDGV